MTASYEGSVGPSVGARKEDGARLPRRRDPLESAEALTALTPSEIDDLPFGYIALTRDGTILRYNRYEASLSRLDPRSVIGKNFFSEVAPCTQVKEFEGKFRAFANRDSGPAMLSFDFVFAFRHGLQNVRIGMVRSPANDEVIMTVNRYDEDRVTLDPGVEFDAHAGIVRDRAGNRVVTSSSDIWRALDSVLSETTTDAREASMQVGLQWGMQHTFRVDRHIQRDKTTAIREVTLADACRVLSRSIATIGLGRFKLDPSFHAQGLLLVEHLNSPFVEFYSAREHGACAMLAGVHAGQFSYLSGRRLAGREIRCSQKPEEPCRFVVAKQQRIDQLSQAPENTADGRLFAQLRALRGPQAQLG